MPFQLSREMTAKAHAALGTTRMSVVARVRKLDAKQQIMYAEVYAPNVLDTHGEMMRREDVELLAHRFMQLPELSKSIDTNHDNVPNGSYPVESFIARDGDPDFAPGSWVLGVKVPDREVWSAVERGDINGYSFEAYVRKLPAIVVVSLQRDNVGETEEADGHTHLFYAVVDDEGRVSGGRTSTDNGHSHVILKGTATEPGGNGAHSHRFFV